MNSPNLNTWVLTLTTFVPLAGAILMLIIYRVVFRARRV
jgi:hypothetical protein